MHPEAYLECLASTIQVWVLENIIRVDLCKNFGVGFVLDLFGEGTDVLQMLRIICATVGVEIKIEPLNSCSLRAARIRRPDFDVL